MNTELWRETLFDRARDSEIRGSSVLSDLQRRAFEGPIDYLALSEVDQIVELLPAVMQPAGVGSQNPYDEIYQNRQSSISGGQTRGLKISLLKRLSPKEWGRKVGLVLIAMSMFGLMYVGLPVAIAQVSSSINQINASRLLSINPSESHVIIPSPSPLYPVLSDNNNFAADDLYRYKDFRLVIPKIGLESVIIKNVDPNNVAQYSEQLANGVAHALGSYLPGEDGTMFLFAHSTDAVFNIEKYNAKFYAVRKLEVGDEILIRYGEKLYRYQVRDKKIISPGDLAQVTQSGYRLVLSTCYPPGTDWQRLVIFADSVVDN